MSFTKDSICLITLHKHKILSDGYGMDCDCNLEQTTDPF